MRAKNEDSLPSSYSHKNCTRPNPSPECKQFFTSQNVVGLSARDKCLIGTAKSYFLIRWRMGWKACPWQMESRLFQFPGSAWALPFARTT